MNKPSQPLISIALCTYNAGSFLEKQIFSILNQSYKNIEIIAVDDCSSDGTYEVLKTLTQDYSHIKIYRNESNLGFNKNFEKAISLCSGDYIAISDQDDIWKVNKLEILFNNIKDNWLVFSNSELMDHEENLLKQQIMKPGFSMQNRSFKSFLFYNSVTGHTSMFSRKFLNYCMPIPAKGYYDWWMGFVAIYHQKAIYVNQCLTLHRVHQNSVMYNNYNVSKKAKKIELYNEVATNLYLTKDYKLLTVTDRNLINKIHQEYLKKLSLFLINLVVKHYKDYFPDLKPRNWFSRLNFAIKFTKGI